MSTVAEPKAARPKQLYRLPVILLPELPEDGGGYSVLAVTFPACSQGDTEAEALANIVEAILGCWEVYEDRGRPIPWRAEIPEQHEPNAIGRWVELYA